MSTKEFTDRSANIEFAKRHADKRLQAAGLKLKRPLREEGDLLSFFELIEPASGAAPARKASAKKKAARRPRKGA